MKQVPITHGFYKSEKRVLAGVCAGIADKFQLEPWFIRLLWLASVFFLGTGLLIYLVLAFILPRKGHPEDAEKKIFLGVCRNLSIRYQWDVVLIRLLASLFALSSLGAAAFVYLGLYFLLPQLDDTEELLGGPERGS